MVDQHNDPWWKINNLLFWIVLDLIVIALALFKGLEILAILVALVLVHLWRLEKRLNDLTAAPRQ
jgi:hypothetical protein